MMTLRITRIDQNPKVAELLCLDDPKPIILETLKKIVDCFLRMRDSEIPISD